VSDLFEEFVPRVYLFALRLTRNRDEAEDLTQETFLQAWRHRARLRDPRAARAWLFSIAVNLWRSRLRRRGRRQQAAGLPDEPGPRPDNPPEENLIVEEDVRRVRKAIDELPARQRQVVYLRACEALPLREIAGVLGISLEAVRSSLSLARKRLRRQLKDLDCVRFPTE
jgi:RNA polymerase sigma-70 factor (ECF subfamily)